MTIDRFSIDLTHEEDRVTLALAGEIDYGNVARLRSVLLDVVRGPQAEVVVDLAEVQFVDSTVLGVLVQGKNRLHGSGRSMQVVNLSNRVRRTFELAGAMDYLGA